MVDPHHELKHQIRLFADIKKTDTLLDIGCGTGWLSALVDANNYNGFDVNRGVINNAISSQCEHVDVMSLTYNPNGVLAASNLIFPYASSHFSAIVAWDVFTHIYEDGLIRYLQEAYRVAKYNCVFLMSLYLDNIYADYLSSIGSARINFGYGTGHYVVTDPGIDPSELVGFNEWFVRDILAETGWKVVSTIYGSWCGAPSIFDQDVIIASKL